MTGLTVPLKLRCEVIDMAFYEEALKANEAYAANFQHGDLPIPPSRKAVVVTCMDARIMPDRILGFDIGEVHVIRNAGGLVTDDALRSLVISVNLLGTREILVIEHTDCGMLKFTDEAIQQQLQERYGVDADGFPLHTFSDLRENLRQQVQRVRACPFIPKDVPVYGLIYHVETGRLEEVVRA